MSRTFAGAALRAHQNALRAALHPPAPLTRIGQPRQAAPVPAGYRSAQPPTPSAANGMYYTSSGQHSSGGGAPTPSRGGLMGQQQQQLGSFPPSSTLGRGGPPGFGGRGAGAFDGDGTESVVQRERERERRSSTHVPETRCMTHLLRTVICVLLLLLPPIPVVL